MNKITLKLELDFDFIVLAITTSLKDYRLCFHLNKFAPANFMRVDELALPLSDNHTVALFNLLSNKSSEGLLIPEMNRVDYFLVIKNFIDKEDLEAWITHLKQIPEVLAAVEVDVKKLKSKENLLF